MRIVRFSPGKATLTRLMEPHVSEHQPDAPARDSGNPLLAQRAGVIGTALSSVRFMEVR